jgi:hypothetical protein
MASVSGSGSGLTGYRIALDHSLMPTFSAFTKRLISLDFLDVVSDNHGYV